MVELLKFRFKNKVEIVHEFYGTCKGEITEYRRVNNMVNTTTGEIRPQIEYRVKFKYAEVESAVSLWFAEDEIKMQEGQ